MRQAPTNITELKFSFPTNPPLNVIFSVFVGYFLTKPVSDLLTWVSTLDGGHKTFHILTNNNFADKLTSEIFVHISNHEMYILYSLFQVDVLTFDQWCNMYLQIMSFIKPVANIHF